MSSKQQSWKPTNKWMAAQCTAVATLAIAWVNAGEWTKPLTIATIGLVSQATAAYLVSNADPSAEATEAESPAGATVQTSAA